MTPIEKVNDLRKVTPKLQAKFEKLIQGDIRLFYFGDTLFCMIHREQILDWFLAKGFYGNRLYDKLQEHGGMALPLIELAVADINRAHRRAIRVGKDYVPR